MSEVVIGTYNMSFMSDLGTDQQFASEAAFLNRNKSDDRRLYWKNALNLLKTFLLEKNPAAVGLQEMVIHKNSDADPKGTYAVEKMLDEINTEKFTKYKLISKELTTSTNITVALSTIVDENVFGKIDDDDRHVFMIDNDNQIGRPILIILTGNNDLLINMHGAQDPKLGNDMNKFNKYMQENNKEFLEGKINEMFKDKSIGNIFLMTDLNDRYDAIIELTILGKNINYNGDAPKSCCHNWDSSCMDYRYKPFDTKYGTCIKTQNGKSDGQPIKEKYDFGKKTLLNPEHEGYIQNYRYRGDKVFGLVPTGDTTLQLFSPQGEVRNTLSTESDHELVYGTFNLINETVSNENSIGGKKKKLKNRSTKKYKKDKIKKRGGNKKSLKNKNI